MNSKKSSNKASSIPPPAVRWAILDLIQPLGVVPQNLTTKIRREIGALRKSSHLFYETLKSKGMRKVGRKHDVIGAQPLRCPRQCFLRSFAANVDISRRKIFAGHFTNRRRRRRTPFKAGLQA